MKRAGLADLEAVVAIARRGSFRAAARDLEVSPTALSHAIASLEARLGVRLFNRTTRSVSLTAAGNAFVAEITPALGVIRGAVEGVNRHRTTPAGVLRINSSSTIRAASMFRPGCTPSSTWRARWPPSCQRTRDRVGAPE